MVGVGGSNPLGRTKFKSPLHAGFFYGYDLWKNMASSITRQSILGERLAGRVKRL